MSLQWTNKLIIIRKLVSDGRLRAAKEWARELLTEKSSKMMLTDEEFEYLRLLIKLPNKDIRFLSGGDDDPPKDI